jgi:thioredoxin 1
MIAPIYDELSTKEWYEDSAVFVKVDVDEVPAVSEKYKVSAMPTFLFLKNGVEIDRFSGASQQKLLETINKHLSSV